MMPAAITWRLRLPRPKTFVGFLSLQTGTEMISLAMLFNRGTGLYGLLAVLTGYALSAFQLSMYIYSLAALVLLAFLMPHIRKQSPFQCLALAWLYIVDTTINTAYTTVFAVNWYIANSTKVVKSGHSTKGSSGDSKREESPVSEAAVVQESATSLVLIVGFTLLRVYFSLVVMAYARHVLHLYVNAEMWPSETGDKEVAKSPFAEAAPLGQGWKGKLGRLMASVGRTYWLGGRDDEEWAKNVKAKMRNPRSSTSSRRSGGS